VWHDELELSDQQQLSTFGSSALALNSTRGGDENNRGILPDCHKLDGLTQGQVQLCLLFFVSGSNITYESILFHLRTEQGIKTSRHKDLRSLKLCFPYKNRKCSTF